MHIQFYRHDSTIANPYYKWAYYDPNVKEIPQTINYAANKTKKVAILISDCRLDNDRLKVAQALQKYIQVLISVSFFVEINCINSFVLWKMHISSQTG